MRTSLRMGMVLALAATVAACGSPAEEPAGDAAGPGAEAAAPVETAAAAPEAPAAPQTPAAAAGGRPASFAQCVACHAVEPGKNGIGPSLAGVAGSAAGAVAGFAYSSALKTSGLTWDDATLDAWLTAPMKKVPGTRMAYAGMADPAKRAELIAYLKTLK